MEDFETSSAAISREAAYPGINAAIWAEVEVEIRQVAAEWWPELTQRTAAFLLTELTAPELNGMRRYMASPAAQEIMRKVDDQFDPAPEIAQLRARGRDQLDPEDTASAGFRAAKIAARSMTAAEVEAHTTCGGSGSIERIQEVNRRIAEMQRQWEADRYPDWNERYGAAMQKAAAKYAAERSTFH